MYYILAINSAILTIFSKREMSQYYPVTEKASGCR